MLTRKDRERVPPDVLAALILAIKRYPDKRLGEIIYSVLRHHTDGKTPMFDLSDEQFALALQNYVEKK